MIVTKNKWVRLVVRFYNGLKSIALTNDIGDQKHLRSHKMQNNHFFGSQYLRLIGHVTNNGQFDGLESLTIRKLNNGSLMDCDIGPINYITS